MMDIKAKIKFLKENWNQPKKASYDNEDYSFELSCIINDGASESEIIKTFSLLEIEDLPIEYKQFLLISNGALLFLDEHYGQAGLNIYSLKDFTNKINFWLSSYRASSLIVGDLIVGEFLGDSDFIILRCDKDADDFGTIIISLPLYEREDWFYLKKDFTDFLMEFIKAEGYKYWE
ncbi:SMI1/KNR4 family protein [Psychrobacter sp. M13]|uniref:SMI1/KNR4 family protein n=1 Tax=Psychrobacter sp. M13 TaxID=3067275 RepID=UPI00273C3E27|nr:SMI1/KNR4 family protein [Psychrobacter sp. M13]WLP94169.1 SMI1/KNR4 family protein [Psychrobacter sp. M13]